MMASDARIDLASRGLQIGDIVKGWSKGWYAIDRFMDDNSDGISPGVILKQVVCSSFKKGYAGEKYYYAPFNTKMEKVSREEFLGIVKDIENLVNRVYDKYQGNRT